MVRYIDAEKIKITADTMIADGERIKEDTFYMLIDGEFV